MPRAYVHVDGWGFRDCLPAFVRLENDLDVRNQWHGQDGPVPIRRHRPDELVPWQAAFLEACAELGLPSCWDTNDPSTTGAGPHAMNKLDGVRMSAGEALARAGLQPIAPFAADDAEVVTTDRAGHRPAQSSE